MAYQQVPIQDMQPGHVQQPGQIYANMGAQIPAPPGTAVQWMQRPAPIPGVPVGLEYMTQIEGLFVKQQVSITEMVTGFDTNNKYVVSNKLGQQCYFAKEESDTCGRIFCGPRRGFSFKILDNMNTEVIRISREFKCCGGCGIFAFCCDCAAYEVAVESPAGEPLGYVKQTGSWWKAKYDILDENRETVLKILGPCCILDGPLCCGDNKFQLQTLDGTEIGHVTKKHAGFVRELGTSADHFGISFPIDLSVKSKATLLGALLLIDFMFFENQPKQSSSAAY